ncbi:MAG: hypothetical protein A2293_12920 [Elusimicrobia bacterium RIFOXYB2_FULL_49_7]|nr:MAG: hypothetical protein A2293_12920 [Elusimicrobia bacterium RIFOXYB2_FULL_49_7]
MAITFSKDKEKLLIQSIQRYAEEYLENEIGELKARLILDFIVKEIGPTIYNQAISDAQAVMQDKVSDLDGSCHEHEFGYWKK